MRAVSMRPKRKLFIAARDKHLNFNVMWLAEFSGGLFLTLSPHSAQYAVD